MVRAGLGNAWNCVFANDFDHRKGRTYIENWGSTELLAADIKTLSSKDVPGRADLAWASFPCQDLSLAGGGAGLRGVRSGTFWPFWGLMLSMAKEDRAPLLIVLENVCGTLSSHEGKDFATICACFRRARYRFGALVIDASLFVPQSRPRLFMIGVRGDIFIPSGIRGKEPSGQWHPKKMRETFDVLPTKDKNNWIWWNLPKPPIRKTRFVEIIEDSPTGVSWHSKPETAKLLRMMSSVNREKVEKAKRSGKRMVGTLYKPESRIKRTLFGATPKYFKNSLSLSTDSVDHQRTIESIFSASPLLNEARASSSMPETLPIHSRMSVRPVCRRAASAMHPSPLRFFGRVGTDSRVLDLIFPLSF